MSLNPSFKPYEGNKQDFSIFMLWYRTLLNNENILYVLNPQQVQQRIRDPPPRNLLIINEIINETDKEIAIAANKRNSQAFNNLLNVQHKNVLDLVNHANKAFSILEVHLAHHIRQSMLHHLETREIAHEVQRDADIIWNQLNPFIVPQRVIPEPYAGLFQLIEALEYLKQKYSHNNAHDANALITSIANVNFDQGAQAALTEYDRIQRELSTIMKPHPNQRYNMRQEDHQMLGHITVALSKSRNPHFKNLAAEIVRTGNYTYEAVTTQLTNLINQGDMYDPLSAAKANYVAAIQNSSTTSPNKLHSAMKATTFNVNTIKCKNCGQEGNTTATCTCTRCYFDYCPSKGQCFGTPSGRMHHFLEVHKTKRSRPDSPSMQQSNHRNNYYSDSRRSNSNGNSRDRDRSRSRSDSEGRNKQYSSPSFKNNSSSYNNNRNKHSNNYVPRKEKAYHTQDVNNTQEPPGFADDIDDNLTK
jgi:hypothetical protein